MQARASCDLFGTWPRVVVLLTSIGSAARLVASMKACRRVAWPSNSFTPTTPRLRRSCRSRRPRGADRRDRRMSQANLRPAPTTRAIVGTAAATVIALPYRESLILVFMCGLPLDQTGPRRGAGPGGDRGIPVTMLVGCGNVGSTRPTGEWGAGLFTHPEDGSDAADRKEWCLGGDRLGAGDGQTDPNGLIGGQVAHVVAVVAAVAPTSPVRRWTTASAEAQARPTPRTAVKPNLLAGCATGAAT